MNRLIRELILQIQNDNRMNSVELMPQKETIRGPVKTIRTVINNPTRVNVTFTFLCLASPNLDLIAVRTTFTLALCGEGELSRCGEGEFSRFGGGEFSLVSVPLTENT